MMVIYIPLSSKNRYSNNGDHGNPVTLWLQITHRNQLTTQNYRTWTEETEHVLFLIDIADETTSLTVRIECHVEKNLWCNTSSV